MRAMSYRVLTTFALAGLAGFASSHAEPVPCDSSRVPCRSAAVTRAAPISVAPWLFVSAVPGGRGPAANNPVVLLRDNATAAPSFATPAPVAGSSLAKKAAG
jgi:hypothetical protein